MPTLRHHTHDLRSVSNLQSRERVEIVNHSVIFKYELDGQRHLTPTTHLMQKGSVITGVGLDCEGKLCLWARQEPWWSIPKVQRTFVVAFTGCPIPVSPTTTVLGTVAMPARGLVVHVLEEHES